MVPHRLRITLALLLAIRHLQLRGQWVHLAWERLLHRCRLVLLLRRVLQCVSFLAFVGTLEQGYQTMPDRLRLCNRRRREALRRTSIAAILEDVPAARVHQSTAYHARGGHLILVD